MQNLDNSVLDLYCESTLLKQRNMPTILREGSYRFYFYSNEKGEPPHVHVQRERFLAKFWLQPVSLASSKRFSSHELRVIQRLVEQYQDQFLEAWNAHINR